MGRFSWVSTKPDPEFFIIKDLVSSINKHVLCVLPLHQASINLTSSEVLSRVLLDLKVSIFTFVSFRACEIALREQFVPVKATI